MGFNSGFSRLQVTSTGASVDLTAVSSEVTPNADAVFDLGRSNLKWDDIYAESLVLATTGTTPLLDLTGGQLWISASSLSSGHELFFSGSGFSLFELSFKGGMGSPTTPVYFSESDYNLYVTEASTSFVSCSFNSGSIAHLYASGVFDFVFADFPPAGMTKSMTLYSSQSSTTPGVITWDSRIIWDAGTIPTLTNGSGSIDVFSFFTSGSNRVVGFKGAGNMSS